MLTIDNMERLQIAAIALTIVVILIFRFLSSKLERRKLPPGPPAWPVIGNLHQLGHLPHHSLTKLSETYGPLLYLRLGTTPTVVVSTPELAKEVLRTQDQVFSSRPKTIAGDVFALQRSDMVWNDVGPHWKLLRKISSVELLSIPRIASYKTIRNEEILSTVQQVLAESKAGRVVAMNQMFDDLTVNNITRMMMGKRYFGPFADEASPEAKAMRYIMGDVFKVLGSFMPGDYIPSLRWLDIGGLEAKMWTAFKATDTFLQTIVDEHRVKHNRDEKIDVPDFVDLLISLKGEDKLTDDQIKCFIGDMFFGGTDTASNQMHWTMAELMRHPEIKKRAQDELMTVVGPHRLVDESDIHKLTYLQAIVKESFRLHPVGPLLIPHESIEATTMGGYHIPKGSRVFVNVYAIQRDPANWERSLEFDPDRFLNCKVEMKGQDYKLLPFGSGTRMCPGSTLGLLLVHYVLAQVLHTCNWSLPPGTSPEAVDLTETFGMTVPMLNPLKVIASPRLPNLQKFLQEAQVPLVTV